MNRRILINEDERSRILGLHENRRRQEWGMLFEEAIVGTPGATVAGATEVKPVVPVVAIPPATKDEIIAFQEYAVKTKKENLGTKDLLGKGPGVDGVFGPKSQAAWAKYSAEYGKSKEIQTSGNDALTYIYYIKDATGNQVQKTFTTIDELNKAIAAKQVTQETEVWRRDLGAKKPVKDINSVAINDAIASIAPDAKLADKPGSTFKISPDAKQPSKDYNTEQLTAAIKDGSLTRNAYLEVRDASGLATYQPIMQNADAAKIVNLASGPEALKSEIKSTGNAILDAWLKTPGGQTYLSKPDQVSKEAFIDYLEQSGDPIVAQAGGKDAMRKILLGDFSADTKLGRTGQKIGGAFKRAGQALMGKDTGINRGYNPQ